MLEFFKIVLLFVVAACGYGVLQDQITARVCLEYFTVGHPRLIESESPTVLGLFWGVVASWWAGGLVGLGAACAARFGRRPRLTALDLKRSVLTLVGLMGLSALVAGVVGYFAAERGSVWLLDPIASRIVAEDHPFFIADLWAHSAAYGVGFAGGMVLYVRILFRRWRLERSDGAGLATSIEKQ